MVDARLRLALQEALAPLPHESGGAALVLAAGGPAPAMTLLCTGDVLLRGDSIAVATWTGSSAAEAVERGSGFSLLVAVADGALRVEVERAHAARAGALTALDGRIARLRPSREPPWRPELRFGLANGDVAAARRFVAYWGSVRAWLAAGAPHPSPQVPTA